MKYTYLILIILLIFESCSKVKPLESIESNKDSLQYILDHPIEIRLSKEDSLNIRFDEIFKEGMRLEDSFLKDVREVRWERASKYSDSFSINTEKLGRVHDALKQSRVRE